MRRNLMVGGFVVATATALGCGRSVWVPPRLDLQPYGQIGLVTFTIENAKGTLHEFATERFAQEVLDGQYGIELLELGSSERVLGVLRADEFDIDALKALGERYDVPAVFLGHLDVSDVRPSFGVADVLGGRAAASVEVECMLRLVSTESGGTIWRSTGVAEEIVGEVALVRGEIFFDAENPDNAYGRLVDELIFELTRDLRPSRQRR